MAISSEPLRRTPVSVQDITRCAFRIHACVAVGDKAAFIPPKPLKEILGLDPALTLTQLLELLPKEFAAGTKNKKMPERLQLIVVQPKWKENCGCRKTIENVIFRFDPSVRRATGL